VHYSSLKLEKIRFSTT